MEKQEVVVSKITQSKNPDIVMLELRSKTKREGASDAVAFFMEGIEGISDGIERRCMWQPATHKFLEKYRVAEGSILSECIARPVALQIVETHNRRDDKDSNGEFYQKAKINPSTGEELTKDGRPIYRNVNLVMGSAVENSVDVYIKHDTQVVDQPIPAVAQEAKKLDKKVAKKF